MEKNQNLSCILCGKKCFVKLYKINSYDIIKCEYCGLIFTNIPIDVAVQNDFLSQIYSDKYFKGNISTEGTDKSGYEKNYFEDKRYEVVVNARSRLKKIEQLKPQKGRILDIGCAAGFFLNEAKLRGWQPFGIELSNLAADFARNQLNLNVITGIFESVKLPENYYDVITAWDVIEHVFNPLRFIEKAYKILKPDGILVIGTPNIGSLAHKIRKARWKILAPPEHIFYFNPTTLKLLLKSTFDEVNVLATYPPYSRTEKKFKARLKKLLYQEFNILAQMLNLGEYILAYAWKQNN